MDTRSILVGVILGWILAAAVWWMQPSREGFQTPGPTLTSPTLKLVSKDIIELGKNPEACRMMLGLLDSFNKQKETATKDGNTYAIQLADISIKGVEESLQAANCRALLNGFRPAGPTAPSASPTPTP